MRTDAFAASELIDRYRGRVPHADNHAVPSVTNGTRYEVLQDDYESDYWNDLEALVNFVIEETRKECGK